MARTFTNLTPEAQPPWRAPVAAQHEDAELLYFRDVSCIEPGYEA